MKRGARLYCGLTCYRIWQRSRPLVDRFWPRVNKTATCWLWTGSKGNTYGHGSIGITRDGKNYPAYVHRVAWELTNGPIPAGMHVLHRCDVPLCVNPDHLFLGSQSDNLKDAAAKGRFHVPRRRRRKVDDAAIADMFAMREAGSKLLVIATKHGVTAQFVSQVLKGNRRVYTAPQLAERKAS